MRPMTFEKSVHTALWGTESWEISAFETDPSVMAEGKAKGATLRELYPDFPLLFKVIDARERLSVQVHPNETTCKIAGGDPKTEMWCALSDGSVYAGFRPGVTPKEVEAAVRDEKLEELLVRREVKFGDVIFVPGGLVHAIGDGTRLYEVQQSSNTTFRLYDWGRVGKDGKKRELHVERALQSIDCSLPPPAPVRQLRTQFFDFSQLSLQGERRLEVREGEFLALFAARGCVSVAGSMVAEGSSALLPPGSSLTVAAESSHLLLTRFASGGRKANSQNHQPKEATT